MISNNPKNDPTRSTSSKQSGDKKQRSSETELLTPEEVIEILRLDARGLKDPKEVLRHLRRTRQIGFVKLGGRILFRKSDVEDFINKNAVKAIE